MDVDDDNIVVDPNTETEVQPGEEDSDPDSENEDKNEEDVQPGEPLAAGAEMAGIIDYEIAGIAEYSDKSGEQLWRVWWKGYASSVEDSWLHADAFGNAEDMFKAWNKRHHIKVKQHQQKRHRSMDSDAEQAEKPDNLHKAALKQHSRTAPILVDALILAHMWGPQQLEAKLPKKKSKKSYLVDVSPSVALEDVADPIISVSTSTAPINGAPSSSTSTPAVWPAPELEEVPKDCAKPPLFSDKHLAAAVMSTKEEVTLQPPCDKLAQIIDLDPDIPFYAEELAWYIHHRTLELKQLPKKGTRGKHIPVDNLQPDQVVDPSVAPVLFAIPAIILREALIKMGSASVNLRLLKGHIPGVKATTDIRLLNLLAWMLMGQGFTTQKFLSQQTFFFADANECIDTFKEFQASNKAVVSQYLKSHLKAMLASMKKLANYAVLDDANVWGQAANDLMVNPTIRGTGGQVISHENKSGPPFTLPVKHIWKDFTREFFNKDLDEHPDIPCRKWLEGLQMIQSLGINGMKGMLNKQAQRSGVNSKNSVRLYERELLAWSQQ
ncbi:hypothetical protein K438DRAFT_2131144 [Mycena galopus ATCC 62051]|nr:hypothetical protein K438DRAFT_2131144 [Mycena galopus ATCC 62051]